MSLLYVNNNGQVTPNNLPTINFGNRGHLYGDGVFESIRVINGKIINLQNHWMEQQQSESDDQLSPLSSDDNGIQKYGKEG